jgi:hypothetical protein
VAHTLVPLEVLRLKHALHLCGCGVCVGCMEEAKEGGMGSGRGGGGQAECQSRIRWLQREASSRPCVHR